MTRAAKVRRGVGSLLLAVVITAVGFAAVGVVAYLALVPGPRTEVSLRPAAGSSTTMVAIGDSYMSGEGARTFYAGTDRPGRDKCRRASSAYPELVAQELGADLTFVACSGAETINITPDLGVPGLTPEPQYPRSGAGYQIQALTAHPDADLVVVSIGGNDARFSEVVASCMGTAQPCLERAGDWEDTLVDSLQLPLRSVFAQVRTKAPAAAVYAVTYPIPFDDGLVDCPEVGLTASEVAFLRSFVDRLNLEIGLAAAAEQVRVVDLSRALEGGGLCAARPSELLNGWRPQRPDGLPREPVDVLRGSFHPTEAGHRAMAQVVAATITADLNAPPTQPPTPPPTPGGTPPGPADGPPQGVPPNGPPIPPYGPPVGPFPASGSGCPDASAQEIVEHRGGPHQLAGGWPGSTVCFQNYKDAWQQLPMAVDGSAVVPFPAQTVAGNSGYRTVVYRRASGEWVQRILTPPVDAPASDFGMVQAWLVGSTRNLVILGVVVIVFLGTAAALTRRLYTRR